MCKYAFTDVTHIYFHQCVIIRTIVLANYGEKPTLEVQNHFYDKCQKPQLTGLSFFSTQSVVETPDFHLVSHQSKVHCESCLV